MDDRGITVRPTYGFDLTTVLPAGRRLGGDEHEAQVELGDPVGRITLEARLGRAPRDRDRTGPVIFIEADKIMISGHGYATAEEAWHAGYLTRDAVRLAAAQTSTDLAIGSGESPRVRHAQATDEPGEQGLCVYRDGLRAGGSLRGRAVVITPLPNFTAALHDVARLAGRMDHKRALACDLAAQSGFETSLESRHLLLVTALEVLSEHRPRTGRAAELVEKFLADIEDATKTADESERKELASLRGGVEDLQKESIGAAVRRLAAPVTISGPGWEGSTTKLVNESYGARSDLVHGGETNRDLSKLYGALQLLVRKLCLAGPV